MASSLIFLFARVTPFAAMLSFADAAFLLGDDFSPTLLPHALFSPLIFIIITSLVTLPCYLMASRGFFRHCSFSAFFFFFFLITAACLLDFRLAVVFYAMPRCLARFFFDYRFRCHNTSPLFLLQVSPPPSSSLTDIRHTFCHAAACLIIASFFFFMLSAYGWRY